jgi:two-component system, NtrC family, C4-dicarboxylate transport sensor histidine kinase DctB
VLVFTAAALAIACTVAERIGTERLREAGAHKLDLYAASLDSALAKYEYLPGIVTLKGDVVNLLRSPRTPGLHDSVNRYLAQVNSAARSAVLYVIDTKGRTLASSNWDEEASFVGRNLDYRPYVGDALRSDTGRFYGIGTTSGKPGFYYSRAIRDGNEAIGVAVAKVSLDPIEQAWAGAGDIALVVDASGVVFLASKPEWKYKTYGPLGAKAAAMIEATRQYSGARLTPLALTAEDTSATGAQAVTIADEGSLRRYLVFVRPTSEPSWRLILLADSAPVSTLVRNTLVFTAVVLAFLLLLALYLRQRRHAIRESVAAREALQRANDELERKVAERTSDLVATNEHLSREVAERQRAEQVLREAQDELVHAGKMAVLGQMSAGMTHELNQPLAALRTLSDNALVLLARNRTDDVQNNLTLISQLTERMGKITGQFKAFARKSPLQLGPVSVRQALGNALALLDQRLRNGQIAITQDLQQDDVKVLGDANRLEQVLVNLFANALDAMQGAAVTQLEIVVREHAARVSIVVRDTGPGIAPELLPRLLEPFVTTKEQGAGLGLGLAVSAGIVREFGGSLVAANRPQGGAEFTIELASMLETRDA